LPQRITVTVRGLVQGVGFRWQARRRADALGLCGTVGNLADGSVRIVAEGERAELEALLAWARHGPPHARVDGLEAVWGEAAGGLAGFAIVS